MFYLGERTIYMAEKFYKRIKQNQHVKNIVIITNFFLGDERHLICYYTGSMVVHCAYLGHEKVYAREVLNGCC